MSVNGKHICKNCGTVFAGSFCPECGQAANVQRFTVKGTLKDLYVTLSVSDNTFYTTVKGLVSRPGHMVREFLVGERKKYLKPINMLVGLVAVYIIITNLVFAGESYETRYIRDEFNKFAFLGSGKTYITKFFVDKVYSSLLMALLCTIPFRWVFSKDKINFKELDADGQPVRSALNLAEHFHTIVYIACQLMIISYIEIPLRLLFGYEIGNYDGICINIILYTICYKQLLGISWVRSAWKVIVGILLMSFFFIAILMVMVVVACQFDPTILPSLRGL